MADELASEVVRIAVELMEIDSTSGREQQVVQCMERMLVRRGWQVRRIPVRDGRDDLLATGAGAGTDAHETLVTLSTHLDTVPPYIAPRVHGGRLWGRGACDAKGIAASMILAAERLRAGGVAVALLFVVGEERWHDGAHAANAVPTTSKVLINGEPTERVLATGTKGAIRFTLRTRGEAAHSAYPERGRSAIDAMVALLAELPSLALPVDDVLGATTINVGTIAGGVADNVVAPAAEAQLMARLATSPQEGEALLRGWVAGRAELEVRAVLPPVRCATLDGFRTGVMAYGTDIPQLTAWGTPYLFGPGSIHVAHRDDEHVEIAELERAVDDYETLALGAQRARRVDAAREE